MANGLVARVLLTAIDNLGAILLYSSAEYKRIGGQIISLTWCRDLLEEVLGPTRLNPKVPTALSCGNKCAGPRLECTSN